MNTITSTRSFRLTQRNKDVILDSIRYACIFLFIYTAYAKIIGHQRFLNGLSRVHLLSGYAVWVSYLVPTFEIIIAVLLILPKTIRIGLIGFVSLMTMFTVYIISAMIWENLLPCQCGGAIEKLTWMQHVWFNLAFILLATLVLRFSKSSNHLKI